MNRKKGRVKEKAQTPHIDTHIHTEIDLTKAQNQNLYYVTEKISPPEDQIQRPTIGQSAERKNFGALSHKWNTSSLQEVSGKGCGEIVRAHGDGRHRGKGGFETQQR